MKTTNREEFEKQNVFGTGNANTAYAQYFTGKSFLNPLTNPENGLFLANVTFEPGCRNNWHIHHATKGGGQLLVCTAGEGWYQEEGKEDTSESEEQTESTETGEAQESNSQSVASVEKMDLHFSGENTLALPVVGKVLVNFSMEEPVYFATLEQYRLSPAMVIGVTEGTDVAAMWEAQITDITHSNELGNLVTMSFGDGYECIYGQLDELQVSVGSYVKKGDIIGKVAAPTKYYSVEGANLYLELLKDEVPVDPLSFMNE